MRGFYLMLILLIIVSCKTSQDPIPEIGLDYFPLKVGGYQLYTVEETQIKQSIEQKSIYELKLQVIDSALNEEGGYTYIIQRQKRGSINLPWIDLDSWTARIANRKAIVTEGNTSLVKVTFPLQEGLEWDGNAFNTLGGEEYCGESKDRPCDTYRMENADTEFAINDMMFDHAVTIIQSENNDLIVKQDVRSEVYAKGVGLIYKESVVLEYCTKSSCLGQQKIDNGLRFKQVLKEYGSN